MDVVGQDFWEDKGSRFGYIPKLEGNILWKPHGFENVDGRFQVGRGERRYFIAFNLHDESSDQTRQV